MSRGRHKGRGCRDGRFEPMTLGPSRRKRQHGIEPSRAWDCAFCPRRRRRHGWRGQIESNDVGGFRFERCIVGSHEVEQHMRLQPVAPPDASDTHVPRPSLRARRRLLKVKVLPPSGRAASTPALRPQSGRIGSGLSARDAGRRDRSSVSGGTDWSSADHTKCCSESAGDLAHALPARAPQHEIGTASTRNARCANVGGD